MMIGTIRNRFFFTLTSSVLSLILLTTCTKIDREPKVESGAITGISIHSATAEGNILDTGEGISNHGHCWGTTANPLISGSKTSLGPRTNTGTFTSNLTSLQPGTKYYIRAFAQNGELVVYGNETSFTTIAIALPSLTTSAVTSVTQTSAVSGGNITSDGGAEVTSRGVCWSVNHNPTISGSKTTNGSGPGTFTSNITGLTPNTTYYFRAYATNSAGTAYGSELTFTTPPNVTLPTVTTSAATATSTTTAAGGGNVTSDGGGTVTARGVCWSTSSNPTISGSRTTNGSGPGTFTSSITGLTPNTTYHVRAYATNSAGTAYGSDLTFSTPPNVTQATVTTSTATATSSTTATGGGNVTSDGGATVTARGVCWGTGQNPTISGSRTTDGTGPGPFTSSITGLSPNTTYYVRAYATNSAGTAYGSQVNFTTLFSTCVPSLLSPVSNAILDNGCYVYPDTRVWNFDWSSCTGATMYNLYVIGPNTTIPELNIEISDSQYTLSDMTFIFEADRNGWRWRVRAYVNGVWGDWSGERTFSVEPMNADCPTNAVTDIDGNVYTTVAIGSQIWMRDNLRTTRYNDGSNIPEVMDTLTWNNLASGGFCWYNHNEASYRNLYGGLYNWYAVNSGRLCPTGWHVPSDAEWETLTSYLGGVSIAGGKLKEAGTSHWSSPNTGANNESNFTGLPGGYRGSNGSFSNLGQGGFWWSSSEYPPDDAWIRGLYYYNSIVGVSSNLKNNGFSVRCIMN